MENRENLLRCAQALFAARGYDAVGVQEIVDAAGVTKPTLYHYFGNKRGLLDALLEERFTGMLPRLRQAATQTHDVTMTLRQVAQVYFDFARQDTQFYRMQLSMQFASPDSEPAQAVARFGQEQYEVLEAMFARAAEMHGNMRGRQCAYAATLIGMINTYVAIYLSGQIELTDDLVYRATHQFMHGIFS
jgi:AcrR family transcriptional regulator